MHRKNDSPKLDPGVEIVYSLKLGGKTFSAWVVMPHTRFWAVLSRSLVFVAQRFRWSARFTEALLLPRPILPSFFGLGGLARQPDSSSDETWSSGSTLPN